jgi:ferredoxin-NADP reductase
MIQLFSCYKQPLQMSAKSPRVGNTVQATSSKGTALSTDRFELNHQKKGDSSPVYESALSIGEYGLPTGHLYEDCFKAERKISNLPGVVHVNKIRSLDPSEKDPAKAYASEITLDLKGTRLSKKTTPGEHISFLDISNPDLFPATFHQKLRKAGSKNTLKPEAFFPLKDVRVKNFTIASPQGGERNWLGRPNGKIKLIVRRVETAEGYKGPLTNFLVSRKKGDGLVFAAPISHHFLGPKANTPALFLGVGSSVSPYIAMLRTRFEQERGPYAETYLGIGHTRQSLEYERKALHRFANKPNHHFTYRPVFSRESEKSNDVPYVQSLIQKPEEAQKIFNLILNPKSQIYISGFWGFSEQIEEALKKSALSNPQLGVTVKQLEAALETAKQENRYHVEGEIRQDLAEGLQGY